MLSKAQTLEDIRRFCKPVPLAGAELEGGGYFIETDRARDPNQDTRQRLTDALKENDQARILFYGHRGCGKSTVLNKFVAERGAAYLPVQFSVEDEMTPSNARAEDLLLVIAERVLSVAENQDLEVDGQALQGVLDFFAEVEEEATKERDASLEISAGIDAGKILGALTGLFAKFKSDIKFNSHSKQTTVAYLRKRPGDLVAQVNAVIAAVEKALPAEKQLLVMVEDIDKLDLKQARAMYVDNVSLLAGVRANIIYTIPIFLFHAPDANSFLPRFDAVIGLPMINVAEIAGQEVIREIVHARVDPTAISGDALELLIGKTGGVVRHVFEALVTAANMSKATIPLEKEHIEYGLMKLGQTITRQIALPYDPVPSGPESQDELIARLAEYARVPKAPPRSDATNQILLMSCALVEYNGKGWFGVHPLVAEWLKQLGRI